MASNPKNVRLNVLMKLQEALDEDAILEKQILSLMHRFADRFTDRADMKKCVYLKSVRDELLRNKLIKGDEASLQKALSMVHKNAQDYVVVLFYASWCPFSITFRPSLSVMASLYPSVAHFAIEESVIRPSILSKYGVHGFPTLFVLNSTMRARYHGSRTLGSLMTFYTNVT
ncbi:5'-adenylylsulfate reductase-like protein 4, partial [Tanacetum coccineum]